MKKKPNHPGREGEERTSAVVKSKKKNMSKKRKRHRGRPSKTPAVLSSKDTNDSSETLDSDSEVIPSKVTRIMQSEEVPVSIQEVKKTLAASLEDIKKKLNPNVSAAEEIKSDDFYESIKMREDDVATSEAYKRIHEQVAMNRLPNNLVHFKFASPRKEVILKLSPKVLEMSELQSQNLEELVMSLSKRGLLTSDAQDMINSFGALPEGLLRTDGRKGASILSCQDFTEEIKRFATMLFFCSPESYNSVCKIFRLPSKAYLRTRLQVRGYVPGFSLEALTVLKKKASQAPPSERICSLMFDTVFIKREHSLDQAKEKCIGIVDFSFSKEPYNCDEIHLATEVLLFVVVGLGKKWKVPIGYFFHKGLSGELLKNIVQEAIIVLEKQCALDVRALVCNGSSSSVKMGKLFGCNIRGTKFNHITPNFPHPLDAKRQMYLIFGIKRALKLLLNLLKDKICLQNSVYGVIDWKFFEKLFGDLENEKPKINSVGGPDHLKFIQLQQILRHCKAGFSCTLSSALELVYKLQLPYFVECEGTSFFAADLHRSFGLLNSREQLISEENPPMHLSTMQEQVESLTDVADRLFDLESVTGDRIEKGARWMSVMLYVLTLKSVSNLAVDLLSSKKLKYFSAYRVNLDHFDVVLNSFHRWGNWNGPPSPSDFQNSFRCILEKYTQNFFCNYDFEGVGLDVGQGEIYSQIDFISLKSDCDSAATVSELVDLNSWEIERAKCIIKQTSKRLSCPQCMALMLQEIPGDLPIKTIVVNQTVPSRFLLKLLTVTRRLVNEKSFKLSAIQKQGFSLYVFHEFLDSWNFSLPKLAVRHMFEDPHHITGLIKIVISSYITLRLHGGLVFA